jgi:hypothetical protein
MRLQYVLRTVYAKAHRVIDWKYSGTRL